MASYTYQKRVDQMTQVDINPISYCLTLNLWRDLKQAAAEISDPICGCDLCKALATHPKDEKDRWIAWMSFNLWNEIILSSEFGAVFNPATKTDITDRGHVGFIDGVAVYVDMYQKQRQILLNKTLYMFYGNISDRIWTAENLSMLRDSFLQHNKNFVHYVG